MARIVRYALPDNEHLLVEVDVPDGYGPIDTAGGFIDVPLNIDRTISAVSRVAELISTKLKSLPQSPKELSIELGIKLSVEGSIIVAKGEAESNWKITMKW
jgi:NTP-dependent ternary system trypsin peptidase co-occuring protein